MSEEHPIITPCPACDAAMDVTAMAPFTRVACPACGEETRVKTVFGIYRLERRLAIGGMSVVFVARDTVLDREVALKILNEDYSTDERRISAFEHEARVTASLSHPNIVRVLKTGRAFGRFFIAMELVPGGHFEGHIRKEGKIPEARVLRLAIQVANGLKAAQAANLIHRDVKPGNILLDADGNAKLVDFGLALVTHGGTAQAKELWATPYYVPPETIEGAPEDFRSDIYAFGATWYHALAGRPSCGEERMATDILRAAKKNVVPLHQAEPSLSSAVCDIIDKAMAYEPTKRHASYDELLRELEDAAKHAKRGVTRETAGDVAKRRLERKRHERRTLAASAAIVAVAVAGGLFWVLRDDTDAPSAGEPARDAPADSSGADMAATDLAARPIDVAGRYDEARELLRAGDFAEAARAFERLRENREIQEPTRSWAGVEAVLAAYLGGSSGRARELAEAAARHIRSARHDDPGLRDHLPALLQSLARLPPLPYRGESGDATADASELIGWMLAGLKNWEQGMPVEAAPFFRAVADADVPEQARWAAFYQEIAGDYLHDFELLSLPVFSTTPADGPAASAAIRELDDILAKLRTQGRARFNVRAWQLDLARHRMRLDNAPAVEPVEPPGERFARLAADCRFVEAAELLGALPDDELPRETRDALMRLAEAGGVFLEALEEDIAAANAPLPELLLKSGEHVRNVRPQGDGALIDGDGRRIRWADVATDALIDLHRERVRQTDGELERLRRHECAIAFDLLAGDRERALAAAARLAEQHPEFRQRWDTIHPHLPD